MTMAANLCREFRDRLSDRFFSRFPCLSDPGRRSSLCLKVALVIIHLVYLGVLFFADRLHLIQSIKSDPWYIGLYLLLFVVTLIQYFITSGSSPGYVIDAMRATNERESLLRADSINSKQPASSTNGSVIITVDGNSQGRTFSGSNATSWAKLVMVMYHPGTSMRQCTCTYCNVLQPPRAKHCHDCDKCVLQFDHHCVWLGTCIGQGNHCRFWWYICEETALCLWTGILYITYLKANIARSCFSVDIRGRLMVREDLSHKFHCLNMHAKKQVDGCDHDSVGHYFVNILGLSCAFADIPQLPCFDESNYLRACKT